MILFHYPSGDG